MFEGHRRHSLTIAWNWFTFLATMVLAVKFCAAQDSLFAIPRVLSETSAVRLPRFSPSLSASFVTSGGLSQASNAVAAGLSVGGDSTGQQPVRSGRPRRITLAQAKQQSANRLASPLAHMSELSVEAAKQHRLGVEADYFPKFSATFLNLHATDFLGDILKVRNAFKPTMTQVPVPFVNQDMTVGALTFVQPLTPLLEVRQAVQIARADERIAMAKAATSISKNARDMEIEEIYFKLLIAQRQLISTEWKLASEESLYASASESVIHVPGQESEPMGAKKAVETAAATVRGLTASMSRFMGWPDDIELELASS